MRVETKTYDLKGHKLVIRCAEKDDAAVMIPYLKRVCGETRFLLREADECMDLTIEQEAGFINNHNESERACLLIAELDGEYVGNASFDTAGRSRRTFHRAEIGIALYLDYTGMGIGSLLFAELLDAIEKCDFEQAELTVVGGNERAIHMYRKFGFVECGRILNANKYDDGTYADDIKMVKILK